ncbi:solute carrier family 22 member 4-like [Amblyomma americanum]
MHLLSTSRLESKDLLTSESFDCRDAFGHGFYQSRLMLICAIAAFVASSHSFVFSLISGDVEFWCKQPWQFKFSLNDSTDAVVPSPANRTSDPCRIYDEHSNGQNSSTGVPCQQWEYDNDWAKTTVVSEWNLVCQRQPLTSLMIMIQTTGAAVFALVAGLTADYAGRAPVLVLSLAILLVSAVGSCLSRNYTEHATAKFFTSGSSTVAMEMTGVVLFEVSTHDHRPLRIVVAGVIGLVLGDLWYVAMIPVKLDWEVKQVVFILPGVLLLPAAFLVDESPRWLIANSRHKAVEAAMLTAAKTNHFPLPSTACLVEKLNRCAKKNALRRRAIIQELFGDFPIRLRTLTMCGCSFTCTFATYVAFFSAPSLKTPWRPFLSFIANVSGYAVMHLFIMKFSMLTVIMAWFVVLFGLQCLLSVTVVNPSAINELLILLDVGFYYTGGFVFFVYVLELFPTAVRTSAAGLTFAFGRVGAICASSALVLKSIGREDVAFATAACLVFASLVALRGLPPDTAVECARGTAGSVESKMSIKHMKNTLGSRLRCPGKARRDRP